MTVPDLAIRSTIWLSLLSWGGAEWLRLRGRGGSRPMARDRDPQLRGDEAVARLSWTVGAAMAVVHVALAFHFKHAWSHAAAVADTARQTQETLGFALGEGVYVNYAFVVLWVADVFWWWLSPVGFRTRPAALDRAIRLFILFIFVNGAVVFPRGPVRVLGAVTMVALCTAWYRDRLGAGTRKVER